MNEEHELTQYKVLDGHELHCNECSYVVYISHNAETIRVLNPGNTAVTHFGKIIQPSHEISPELFTNAYTTLN